MVLPFLALGIAPQAPVALIIFWFCLYAVASGGPNILEWSYPNELFPTDIRATAMGVITAVSRIGAALGTFLLPLSLDHLGDGPTMLIIAGMTAVGFIVSYALAPENKGRSLSETSSI